jgi:hypothetical protein
VRVRDSNGMPVRFVPMFLVNGRCGLCAQARELSFDMVASLSAVARDSLFAPRVTSPSIFFFAAVADRTDVETLSRGLAHAGRHGR